MKTLLAFSLNDIPLGEGQGTIENTYSSSAPLITVILKNSLTLASIILLGLLIFGGVTFIINAGRGDSKKAQQGKSAVTNAVIGFAIVLLAFTIIQIIQVITGLHILDSGL